MGKGHERLPRCWIVEVRMLRRRGRMLRTIKGIDDQNRIPCFGKALAHLPERRAQAIDVRPDQHRRMLAACWVHEVTVRLTVGRLDVNLDVSYLGGVDCFR